MSAVRLSVAALCILGSFVLAAPAQGQSLQYVDEDGTGATCELSNPCDQISDATAVAGTGSKIFVGADLYTESVTLNSGVSLIASNFNPAFTADNGGVTAIDGGAGNGILVDAGVVAREIRGLTIEGDADAIEIQGGIAGTTVSIIGNTFPSRDNEFDSRIQISNGAGAANVTIEGNSWTWGAAVDLSMNRYGVFDDTVGALNANVRNNTFDAVSSPLVFSGNDPQITGNTMTRVYEDTGGTIKRAIDLTDSDATIEGNSITGDATSGLGILIDNDSAVLDTPVLRRNSITGFDGNPLNVRGNAGTADRVTVSDSLLTTTGAGMAVSANGLRGTGFLALTGVTMQNPSGSSIYVEDTDLLLDSSIQQGGIARFGMTTCDSTFSRGPSTGTPGDLTDCNDFATTAPPGFVSATDFRLASGSAMIDAGNPVSTTPLDLAGNPRALLGTPSCLQTAGRQDIGAYEFVGQTGVGCPVPAAQPPPTVKKKCKKPKKKKGKKASAAAKKKPKGCKKKRKKKK